MLPKEFRIKKKLSMVQLAQLAGVNINTVLNAERAGNLTMVSVVKRAKALGVNPKDYVDGMLDSVLDVNEVPE